MTVETLSVVRTVHYRQTISPQHQTGSFVGDDTDNHDFKFEGRGKGVLNIEIDNAPNAELSWALYGMHALDGDVGDAGTFPIDDGAVAAASKGDEGFMGYSFPWYLLRLTYAAAPTDSPSESVNAYVNLNTGL